MFISRAALQAPERVVVSVSEQLRAVGSAGGGSASVGSTQSAEPPDSVGAFSSEDEEEDDERKERRRRERMGALPAALPAHESIDGVEEDMGMLDGGSEDAILSRDSGSVQAVSLSDTRTHW